MYILTDNLEFSGNYFDFDNSEQISDFLNHYENFSPFFKSEKIYKVIPTSKNNFWDLAIINEFSENSQFDTLLKISSQNKNLPEKLFCLAGYGKKFHGFRNRHWESNKGNIHLSCYFKPNFNAYNTGLGFTILAAVSVIETLDLIPGLESKSQIKWVNDIIVNNSKICGVIAQTQIQGKNITDAVIGIGLNVEVSPSIIPTSFVPNATCINDHSECPQDIGMVNQILLQNIEINYRLLSNFGYKPLLEKYIQRSLILGREVSVWSDPHNKEPELITKGKVVSIGDYLELYLDNHTKPITDGRIVIE